MDMDNIRVINRAAMERATAYMKKGESHTDMMMYGASALTVVLLYIFYYYYQPEFVMTTDKSGKKIFSELNSALFAFLGGLLVFGGFYLYHSKYH